MSNIKTNQNTTNEKDLNDQLDALLSEAKKINQEIETVNREALEEMEKINVRVGESVVNVEQIYTDLDNIEKEANDNLDKLILEEAEDLAKEEE